MQQERQQGTYLEPPVDVHGMGNLETDDSVVVGDRGSGKSSLFLPERIPSCFDIFAGLWVALYERSVPQAHRDAQQHYLLDELHACTVRLRLRREDIHARLQQHVLAAKSMQARSDKKGLKMRMVGIRRLKGQVERIDTSMATIENNIDEIINSDVTKDIISSLQRSTEAMRNQGLPMGGIEGVQETMDDLQTELTAAQEVTDAIYRGMDAHTGGGAAGDDDDEMLLLELDSLLLEGDGAVQAVAASAAAASATPLREPLREPLLVHATGNDDSAPLEAERVPMFG